MIRDKRISDTAMQRRKFIRNSLTALPLLLLDTSLASALGNTKPVKGRTVVVIGAGIAGLAAAQKLRAKGWHVVVLEAQDKVGGRLRTNRTLGINFDEGASWIHGTQGNPIVKLAKQAGMLTAYTNDDSRKLYDIGGVARSKAAYDDAEAALYRILHTMMKNGNATQSFETVFNKQYPAKANDRLWKFLLSTYVTFDTGDLNKLSSLLYNEGETYGGEERIATNGYDTIAQFLAKGLQIQFNQRVTAINYTNDIVAITHNGTVSQADCVLVTVPLGVLKANTIQFTPALPKAKQTAIENVGMNCVNKFLLTWNKPFWDDVQYISYTPEERDKFNYFVNMKRCDPSVNALMTFAYADYARQTETMTDAQVTGAIMAHLRDIYGSATPNPRHLLRTKWQSNPNAFGAYAYTSVDTQMEDFDRLADPINNKVFFAGEHTEADYFSTAHGAYLSGMREANRIGRL